jgi:acetyl/propionyl-CoA carboxylase alpha subunit/acetyl-CoA carboxylase carboxyltransferase component
MRKLLVANRGEIAVRVMHAAAELGIRTVAVYSADDERSLHVRRADEARLLPGVGASAHLDAERIVAEAIDAGCDALHPGYGLLSESAALAARCEASGIVFVGPRPETLAVLGDKVEARALAFRLDVPVLEGSAGSVDAERARAFLRSLGGGPMILKAAAGGGGRGMRIVAREEEVERALARCRSEARAAFGDASVYAERFVARARHVEIQIVGDGSGAVCALGERDCSVQRRHQKLIEIAPCPSLAPELRERLTADALRIAAATQYLGAGTFEFLLFGDDVDPGRRDGGPAYAFIEANPRLQVEHTVTEEVFGVDLVRLQLQLADGLSLADLGLLRAPEPRGYAVQVRVNAEEMDGSGGIRPAAGTVRVLELPSGHGVRTDTAAHVGYEPNPHFDSLLLKLIGHSTAPSFADALARTSRALAELRIEGVVTNAPFLRRLLAHPAFVANRVHTRFVEEEIATLAREEDGREPAASRSLAGAVVDRGDPLAVLAYGKSAERPDDAVAGAATIAVPEPGPRSQPAPEGLLVARAVLQGTILGLEVVEGDAVRAGQALLIMSAMKMEHVIEAPAGGFVRRILVAEGDTVPAGAALVWMEPRDVAHRDAADAGAGEVSDRERADLAEVHLRHARLLDDARPDAVARRRKTGQRTARENVADLCDPGSFMEFGGLAIAAQRQRRSLDDLIERTPADGLIAGIGHVNGDRFDDERSRCAVLAYDYTVLAGTQGVLNHRKKDRLFEVAERLRLPLVFFTEGGGGRPGDTDVPGVASLDCMAFHLFARLSGLVPLVGVNSGRCFAGNAALLGCCDVVIATRDSNIGMGGPAMIEGGGLGVFRPEEVGPMSVQVPNGVVDVAVADEAEAVLVARQYLSYFQGPVATFTAADQRALRSAIPENRLRVYDVRAVLATLADEGSVLELRRGFGAGMVTALVRIEGRPIGVVANDPRHLAGAIDAPAADKAARFLQLCDAFDVPILFLCDTPGIMVGPEVEKTALVRHCCRMFVVGASLTVPFFTIVLRKSYGLGAQAMGGGSHKAPVFTVSWPTGEFGGMGLEGAVKLGFRKELAAIADSTERLRTFEAMVARAYERGRAVNTASHFEIDDVIDPADSRQWIVSGLRAAPAPPPRSGKKRPCIDTW